MAEQMGDVAQLPIVMGRRAGTKPAGPSLANLPPPAAPACLAAQLEALGVRSCPHCRHGVEVGQGVNLQSARCPACRHLLLVKDARVDAAADAAFRSYSQKQRLRQCPKCGITVEKAEGCNHMRCRWVVHTRPSPNCSQPKAALLALW